MEIKDTDEAFLSEALPCNPVPFINRMAEIVATNRDYVKSPQYKANLWILLAITYGSLFNVNSFDEFLSIKSELEEVRFKEVVKNRNMY